MTFASGMRVRRSRIPTALEDGGTGSRTREEAVAALGVPSLTGANVFTGTINQFSSNILASSVSAGALQATTSVDFSQIATINVNSNDLTFPAAFATYDFPAASGTLALTGAVLQVPYNAQGSTYAASRSDCVINCTGTWTLTLPTAVGFSGQMYFIKNSGAGTVTMAGTGGQTFDGVASPTVAAGASLTVCSDGANWIIL